MKFQVDIEADYSVEDIEDDDAAALEYQDLLYELRRAFPSNVKLKVTLKFRDKKGVWNVWRT